MTVFAIPFAGGNSYCYRDLARQLERQIPWVTLELPGRGKRIQEPLLKSIEAIVDDAIVQIDKHGVNKVSLFGHSMGGLVAHGIASRLESNAGGSIVLEHLFLSGCRAPQYNCRSTKRASMSRGEMIAAINKLGGLPEVISQDNELMNFFEPILRADFGAVDDYDQAPSTLIHTPITVFSGSKDHEVSSEQIEGWRAVAAGDIKFFSFPGGHFFFTDYLKEISAIICDSLGQH